MRSGRQSCSVTMTTLFMLLLLAVTAQQHEGPSSNLVTHSALHTIKRLIQILQQCGMEETRAMKRVYLSSPNVTCNDGSPAGFYLRQSHGSRRWVVFLEGGWYCYDQQSCHSRWQRLRHLMTSRHWPETRSAGGILSMNPEENAFWWNANHVLVPYCTSDSWSGTRAESNGEVPFSFMGATVVRQVVEDLLPLGLRNASLLLLAGSSAGGTGVMVNLDPVADLLNTAYGLSHITVRGVSDSGWFLDRTPYSKDGNSLAPLDAVKKGIGLWQGQVPMQCHAHYHSEPWRCYFGYRAYPTLTSSLFVFQWLFDEAQMTADNVGAPVTKQQWDYIHQMGDSLRASFRNVTAVFAPSCISHSVLTKNDWQSIKIDEISLPQALRCWEMSHPRHRFWVNHDLIRVGPLLPVLRDVKQFLQKTKGEVVILDLHRFPVGFHGRPARHRRLVALLTRELRSIALPAQSVSASTLLRDIWDRNDNRRLIVTYGDKNVATESAWLWGPLSQVWGNQQTPSGLQNFLQQSMDNAKQRSPVLWAAMAELTPTPLDVMFNPTGSLRAMADAVNRNLTSWFRNQWWPHANIVATDFFLGNNLIDVAVAANLRKINMVES